MKQHTLFPIWEQGFFDTTTGTRVGKVEGPTFVNPGHVATVACCAPAPGGNSADSMQQFSD